MEGAVVSAAALGAVVVVLNAVIVGVPGAVVVGVPGAVVVGVPGAAVVAVPGAVVVVALAGRSRAGVAVVDDPGERARRSDPPSSPEPLRTTAIITPAMSTTAATTIAVARRGNRPRFMAARYSCVETDCSRGETAALTT